MAATLLRKVLGSVSPSSTRRSEPWIPVEPSMGAFEALPPDLLMQIFRLLGPRDAARASSVCRSWRSMVSDNRMWIQFLQNGRESWDSVAFAETHLRSGSPSLMYYSHSSQLSFMHVYGQREKVPGSVIIDGGSGYCKYGWSKYDLPSGRCATFLEFGNIESPITSRLRHFFATIYIRMQVKPSSQPVIVSIPICHSDDTESARALRKQLREAIYTVLFDMNVPAVCAINQAVLALYAARRTSGIVVNMGFNVTSVVPNQFLSSILVSENFLSSILYVLIMVATPSLTVLRGKVLYEVGVEIVGYGALKLTGYLRELMQRRNMNFESLYTVRTLKEKLCYVALDYEAELLKKTQASFEVAGEGIFTLAQERFQTAEILFRPQLAGLRAMGLHHAIAHCMDHCLDAKIASDEGWWKTIVLSGGTSFLPGLPERLEKELFKMFPLSISEGFKVIPPQYGADSAWFGAKIVGNVSSFPEAWCMSKKKFRQKVHRNSSFLGSW